MRRSRYFMVLVCVAVVACSARELTQRERAVEQQVVQERTATWARLMNNAKVDSLSLLYHQVPELRVLWSDGRRDEGWDAAGQAIRDFYSGIDYMNFVLQNPQVEVLSKKIAITTFRHSTDVVRRGGLREPVASGQGTIVWIKDPADHLWKIHTEQISVAAQAVN